MSINEAGDNEGILIKPSDFELQRKGGKVRSMYEY